MSEHYSEEIVARMKRYAGSDVFERRQVTVDVLDEWPDSTWSLDGFLDLVKDAVAKIPGDHRGSARVEFEGEWDSPSSLKIRYDRAETDEEVQARIELAHARAVAEIDRERAEYKRLKTKFEAAS